MIHATLNWNGIERINMNGETYYMYADEYECEIPPWVAELGDLCESLGLTPSCLFNAGQIGILYKIYQIIWVWRNFRRNNLWEQNRLGIKIKSPQWYILLQMGSGHQLC